MKALGLWYNLGTQQELQLCMAPPYEMWKFCNVTAAKAKGSFSGTVEIAGSAVSKICIQDYSKIFELLGLYNVKLKPCPQLLGKAHLIITISALHFHRALPMEIQLQLSTTRHGVTAVAGLAHDS